MAGMSGGGLFKVASFTIITTIALLSAIEESPSQEVPSVSPSDPNKVSPIILRAYEIEEISERSNRDGTPGPGEVFSLRVILENQGEEPVDLSRMRLEESPFLSILQGAEALGEVYPGGRAIGFFQLKVESSSPVDTFLSFFLLLEEDTLSLDLHILPQLNHFTLSSKVVKPGESLQFNSFFVDGMGRPSSKGIGEVKVVLKDSDEEVVDGLPLYDDGLHGDGEADDGNFGNIWWTQDEAKDYLCDLVIEDDRYFHQGHIEEIAFFTTIEFTRKGKILLVMDGPIPSYDILFYYRSSLRRIEEGKWTEWNGWMRGEVDTLVLGEFLPDGILVWSSLSGGALQYDEEVQRSVQWFLERGGKLLLCGGGMGSHIQKFGKEGDSLFFSNILRSNFVQSFSPEGYFESVEGIPQDSLFRDLSFKIVEEKGIPQYFAEEIDPLPPAVPFLSFMPLSERGVRMKAIQSTGTAGLQMGSGDSRLIYLSFGLEGIGEEEMRRILLLRMIHWLEMGGASRLEESSPDDEEIATIQNFPNPFTPETYITYGILYDGHLNLRVADITGRTVKVLFEGEGKAGTYSTQWDGIDEGGEEVSSGVYFLNLIFQYTHKEGEKPLRTTTTRKILLLR